MSWTVQTLLSTAINYSWNVPRHPTIQGFWPWTNSMGQQRWPGSEMGPFTKYKWRCSKGAGNELLGGHHLKGSQIVSVISGNTLVLKDSRRAWVYLILLERWIQCIYMRATASKTVRFLPNVKQLDGLFAFLCSTLFTACPQRVQF